MNELEEYIENVRKELFKSWLVKSCLWGAVLFLLLSCADYFIAPGSFLPFLALRFAAALLLVAVALLSKNHSFRDSTFQRMLGLAAVAISAAAIEIMILRLGGSRSPYFAGQVLLAVVVMGFAPWTVSFHAAGAGLLLGVYALPLVAFDKISDVGLFLGDNGFLVAVMGATAIIRYQNGTASRKEMERSFELLRSEQKYRDLFESAMDPIFLLDVDLRYVDVNQRAVDLLGYTKSELLQMHVLDLIPPEQVPRSSAEFAKLREQGGYEHFEGRIRAKDGRWIDVEVNSSAIVSQGRVVGSRDIVRDITERKRFEDDLHRYRKELERHVKERTISLSELNGTLEREVAERQQAERRLTQQLERQRALSTVERSIASSLNLSEILNVFIEQVMGQLGTDAAAVMLYDREHQELAFAASRGFRSNRIMKVTVKAGRSLAGTVIARQTRILIPDLHQADELYPSPEGYEFKNAFMVKDEGFRAYIGIPLTVKGEVKGILEVFHRRVFHPGDDWLEFLDALSQQASIAIDNAGMYAALQVSHAEISLAYDKTIEGWSRALDIRDNETYGHSQRVADLTVSVARAIGISGHDLVHIRRGALLHDIGKLGVPDSILLKPGPLSQEEMTVMRRHPVIAFDILSPIPFLREALDIPYLHHEKWDGTGYPKGIRGNEIPPASRIFAIVDVWDALRSDRPYREAWKEDRVIEHLRAERGRHFDPDIVDVFLQEVRRTSRAGQAVKSGGERA